MAANPLHTLDQAAPIVTLQSHLLREQVRCQRILDVHPADIHERTPVILGSSDEVDHVVAQLG